MFEGHREHMLDAGRHDNLSMCWLMSLGALLGYASLEMAACGMPMVFWNYGVGETDIIRAETAGAVHAFRSVSELAAFSAEFLRDPVRLADVGGRLRQFVVSRHDIDTNIGLLEAFYASVFRSPSDNTSHSA